MMERLVLWLISQNRRYYLWVFWQSHHAAKASGVRLGDFRSWPNNHPWAERRVCRWHLTSDYNAAQPWAKAQLDMTRAYLVRDRWLRQFLALATTSAAKVMGSRPSAGSGQAAPSGAYAEARR